MRVSRVIPDVAAGRLPVQHTEEVQQDEDADRNAEEPQKKVAGHFFELRLVIGG
jgi:hypothetical protein